MHSASCLCGSVRFTATRFTRQAVACHCTQCRKTSGHFWAGAWIHPDDLVWQSRDTVREYQSSPGIRRAFCGTCGSTLYWRPDGRPEYSVSPGLFDGPTGLTITDHWWVSAKGDYYAIADQATQHERE